MTYKEKQQTIYEWDDHDIPTKQILLKLIERLSLELVYYPDRKCREEEKYEIKSQEN